MRGRFSWIRAVILLAILVGLGELYADVSGIDSLLLPAPHEVGQALWQDRGLLWDNLAPTAEEVLLGIAVSAVAGLACAVAIHFSRTIRAAVYPLLVASQTVPIVVVAPLLVAWFGFGLVPKLAIIGLICFFPVVVTTLDGLAKVDPELVKLMRTLGASRGQTFVRVEAPSALPGLFSGAKIAVAVAVIGAILAEQAGAQSGIGVLLQQAIPQLLTARAYAAVVVLSLFAIALFAALTLAERAVIPWAFETGGRKR